MKCVFKPILFTNAFLNDAPELFNTVSNLMQHPGSMLLSNCEAQLSLKMANGEFEKTDVCPSNNVDSIVGIEIKSGKLTEIIELYLHTL